jgi:hypothetical protein
VQFVKDWCTCVIGLITKLKGCFPTHDLINVIGIEHYWMTFNAKNHNFQSIDNCKGDFFATLRQNH